jgi:hypothetical protein
MSLILSGTDGLSDVDGTASTPAIRGTDTNTGIFFPAADTIAFAEGGAEVMRLTSAGAVSFGSSGTAYGTSGQFLTSQGNATPTWTTPTVNGTAKAWLNYNSSSQTINSSFNISSVSYNATGRYTLNFTTAMADANYANVYGGCQDLTSAGVGYHVGTFTQSAAIQTKSTTQLEVCMKSQSGLAANNADVSVAIFR